MALHSPESVLALLRQQKHLPYAHFPEQRSRSVADALRAFALDAGDAIALAAADQPIYVSVLEGIVDVALADGERTLLRRGETRLMRVLDSALHLHTAGVPCSALRQARALTSCFPSSR